MQSINRHQIYGFLGADPQIFTDSRGQPRCVLAVGTEGLWPDAEGLVRKSVDWHRVIVYGKQAEECKSNLQKDQWVFLEGQVRKRTIEHGGKEKEISEIHATGVRFMGGRRTEGVEEADIPFAN